MPNPKLILFDIDGTLLHAGGIGREAKSRAMRAVFGTDAGVKTHPFKGKTDWQILLELLAEHGYTRSAIGERMDEYEAIFAHTMAELVDEYPVTPLQGALELVETLRQRDEVILGLVTGNAAKTAPIKLNAAGFNPAWFVVGAYGNESDYRPDLTRLALQRGHEYHGQTIRNQDVIVIGDTPDDVIAARAISAVAVTVFTGFAERDEIIASGPDYALNDLTEFLALVPLA